MKGALCQGTAAIVECFLLPGHFPACIPPHPETWAGLVRLAGEKTGLRRPWGEKLPHVGCLLRARHCAGPPYALDLWRPCKGGAVLTSSRLRMGALEKMSGPTEDTLPGPEAELKARSAGCL